MILQAGKLREGCLIARAKATHSNLIGPSQSLLERSCRYTTSPVKWEPRQVQIAGNLHDGVRSYLLTPLIAEWSSAPVALQFKLLLLYSF